MSKRPLIVFDVNETLLDLETMEPTFQRIFKDKNAMRLWFANLIMYSTCLTVAGCYVPFTDIGVAAMKMMADTRGIKISDADKKELTKLSTISRPFRPMDTSLAGMVSGPSGRHLIAQAEGRSPEAWVNAP